MNPPCPHLPDCQVRLRPFGRNFTASNPHSTFSHLTCAQSLWIHNLPAQAILQLNHALTLPSPSEGESIYRALVWIFHHYQSECGFIGNPVRHFQHLATRLPPNFPNQALRRCRAWLCFYLAQKHLPQKEFAPDLLQLAIDKISPPSIYTLLDFLNLNECCHESKLLAELLGINTSSHEHTP